MVIFGTTQFFLENTNDEATLKKNLQWVKNWKTLAKNKLLHF